MRNWQEKSGLITSILFHLILFLLALHVFDRDRVILRTKNFLPTETRGYSVEMITLPENTKTTTNAIMPSTIAHTVQLNHPSGAIQEAKAEINFQAVNTKTKLPKRAHPLSKTTKQAKPAKPATPSKPAVLHHPARVNKPKQQVVQPQSLAQTTGIIITQPKHALTPVASSPVIDMSQLGAGNKINSSTNGTGTQAGAFDLRVIEYGQDAAYAINQNIVVPPAYHYVHVTYRAFVILNRQMQFQSMQMVKSTGNVQFDANIAAALRETIYPPLPPGADWNQFHNIDFTIK